MRVAITSKNNEYVFNNLSVINIGSTQNCNYTLDLPFETVISLQQDENGSWYIQNVSKSDKVLFKGQPIIDKLKIDSVCRIMIKDTDEFIGIKILDNVSAVPKHKIQKHQPVNKKTITTIENEDLDEQDIQTLYGKDISAQTKIKIDRRKLDIEKRRAQITKEISFKIKEFTSKIAVNEVVLNILNFFIFIVPLTTGYIMNDIVEWRGFTKTFQTRVFFIFAVTFIVITVLLKQGQYLTLNLNGKKVKNQSSVLIKNMCFLISSLSFVFIILLAIYQLQSHKLPTVGDIIPVIILITVFLCIFIAIFAGFTKNIVAESSEELDKYETREDFQSVVKDYQQWVNLFANNLSKRKLRDIKEQIFNLKLSCTGEYILGIITSPFLALGVSQTLADCFPKAAGFIRLTEGFKFSPIFLALSCLMITFAFHCFATAFATTKRVNASNVIRLDGFSDYNVHGVTIHGPESTKNLKRESKRFFIIALAVVLVEITMNMSYFIGVMGGDILGIVLSLLTALVPTAILIMETNMTAATKFKIQIREEMLEKVDKEY